MTILTDQLEYYRARAPEYDEWFHRRGRYDRGPEANQLWRDDVAVVRQALDMFAPRGDVLELACGTGLWTQQLAQHANSVLAVDGAKEMLAINRHRVNEPNVSYQLANIFAWHVPRKFDVVFFGFWFSHVPDDKLAQFWTLVRTALNETGRVFFVDSLPHPASSANNHSAADATAGIEERLLNDGRRFQIVKRYYEVSELRDALNALGWHARLDVTEHFFLYGELSAAGEQTIT